MGSMCVCACRWTTQHALQLACSLCHAARIMKPVPCIPPAPCSKLLACLHLSIHICCPPPHPTPALPISIQIVWHAAERYMCHAAVTLQGRSLCCAPAAMQPVSRSRCHAAYNTQCHTCLWQQAVAQQRLSVHHPSVVHLGQPLEPAPRPWVGHRQPALGRLQGLRWRGCPHASSPAPLCSGPTCPWPTWGNLPPPNDAPAHRSETFNHNTPCRPNAPETGVFWGCTMHKDAPQWARQWGAVK